MKIINNVLLSSLILGSLAGGAAQVFADEPSTSQTFTETDKEVEVTPVRVSLDSDSKGAYYTIPTVKGVYYTLDKDVSAKPNKLAAGKHYIEKNTTVTIYARAEDGYKFTNNAITKWEYEYGKTPGDTNQNINMITPTAPTYDEKEHTYIIPEQEGVIYSVNGTITKAGTYTMKQGEKVTINAQPLQGYGFKNGSTVGWTYLYGEAPSEDDDITIDDDLVNKPTDPNDPNGEENGEGDHDVTKMIEKVEAPTAKEGEDKSLIITPAQQNGVIYVLHEGNDTPTPITSTDPITIKNGDTVTIEATPDKENGYYFSEAIGENITWTFSAGKDGNVNESEVITYGEKDVPKPTRKGNTITFPKAPKGVIYTYVEETLDGGKGEIKTAKDNERIGLSIDGTTNVYIKAEINDKGFAFEEGFKPEWTESLDKQAKNVITATEPEFNKETSVVTIPKQEHVTYTIDGETYEDGSYKVKENSTITVKAVADKDFEFLEDTKSEWEFIGVKPTKEDNNVKGELDGKPTSGNSATGGNSGNSGKNNFADTGITDNNAVKASGILGLFGAAGLFRKRLG